MFNNIRNPQNANRLIRTWVATGNPRRPLACVWIDAAGTNVSTSSKEAVSSNTNSGRLPLCA
jgi:hypothetical protein